MLLGNNVMKNNITKNNVVRSAMNYKPTTKKGQSQYAKIKLSQEIVLSVSEGIYEVTGAMVNIITEGLLNG